MPRPGAARARGPPRRNRNAGRCFVAARRDRTAIAGTLIVGLVTAAALAAPFLAPHDPTAVDARAILAPPSGDHWLGTDNLGRDMLSRLIYGARWTLGAAGAAAVAIVPSASRSG